MANERKLQDDPGGAVVIERDVPLVDSVLWKRQRAFYRRTGLDAWSDNSLPQYITSNPTIADAYAVTVVAFLRDCATAGLLDVSDKVRIVELGSGSGQFGYLFINRLRELVRSSPLPTRDVSLVLTDFSDEAVERLAAHRRLQPLAEEGSLDFARFDATEPEPLALVHSGEVLDPAASTAPIVVLGNYVLDSLPSDCFRIIQGRLHRSLLTITAREPGAVAEEGGVRGLDFTWRDHPVPSDAASRQAVADADVLPILQDYEATLDDTAVLVPTAAVECIRFFRGNGGPRLFLFGDKGHVDTWELLSQGPPSIVSHGGAFSLMANFDALARYTRAQEGHVLHPPHRPASLVVAGYLFGALEPTETAATYRTTIADGGPDDFYTVKTSISLGQTTLASMLANLRLSRYDTSIFYECFPDLLGAVADAPPSMRPDILRVVEQVWAHYFPIGEPEDLASYLGFLLNAINYHREAIPYFERSLDLHGRHPDATYGLATAYLGLRDLESADKYADETLALDPTSSGARSLKVTLAAQQRGRR